MIQQASDWVRNSMKNRVAQDMPKLSSGLQIRETGSGSSIKNALGYLFSKANNVYSNTQNVALFSSTYFDGHGLSVSPENFEKCCALLAARKSVQQNWLNDKDEYIGVCL